jgi:ribosomal protein S18 acetylase RimI-like enzyme
VISIRQLRPEDDLAPVLDLCREFFAEYEGYHEEFFDTDDLRDDDISGRFLESLESDDGATIIALLDGVVVGYALISVRAQPDFYRIKKVGAISGLMVSKKQRRAGIGSRLLAEARTYFRKRGIKYFTLYTAVANRAALEFYRRNNLAELHTSFIGET